MQKLLLLLALLSPTLSFYDIKKRIDQSSSVRKERIIGGAEAYAGQWPWAAAVYLTTSNGNYFCVGAVLSNQYLLTAGQCVDGAILFTILLGTHQLQGNSETLRVATENYILHPEYNPETLTHDLGLIKFRENITFTTYIRKAYLPYRDTTPGDSGTAIGWGQTTDVEEGLANNLNYVTLFSLSNEECQLYYGTQVTENMLCVAGNYNEGTCVGDSGGPLSQYISRAYDVIIGVSIFVSSNGCESILPSGYTRVFRYNDWIRSVADGV